MTDLLQRVRDRMHAPSTLFALAKGWAYKLLYPMRGQRFSAGSNFRVYGSLTIRGPGTVTFGRDVMIGMHVTPYTHHPDAVISVGDHCFLNGTRFGCQQRIEIGRDCIVGDARLMDTSFHSTRADRWRDDAPVTTRPIRIANNVWLGAQTGVMPGTEIGDNSVVGFGAVCSGIFPSGVLIAGNPAVIVREIEDA